MRWIAYDAHVGIAIEPIGGHYLHDLEFLADPPGG